MAKLSKTGISVLLLASSLTIMAGTVIAPSLTETAMLMGFAGNPAWQITLPTLGVVLFAPLMGETNRQKRFLSDDVPGTYPLCRIWYSWGLLSNPYIVIADRHTSRRSDCSHSNSGYSFIR